ncbi:MAG: hypothetical protein ACPW60_04870 [Methylohalobius sp. ZOD2]|nr:hypothetical protein [Methylothermaceae bacterium]
MRKIISLLLASSLLAAAGTSHAVKIRKPTAQTQEAAGQRNPLQLQDAQPILGKWTLVEVAPRATGGRIPENREWDFQAGGKLVTSGYNRHFRRKDTQQFKYEIKDGMIVTDVPGRPGKQLTYRVYDLQDDSMVLKGGLEGFYFFKRK